MSHRRMDSHCECRGGRGGLGETVVKEEKWTSVDEGEKRRREDEVASSGAGGGGR